MPRIYKVTPPSSRFWDKVNKTDSCWLWVGTRTAAGYGQITMGRGRTVYAHRVSYEMHHGPIPDNYYVCHTCDNPSCVNPSHLWVGTNSDNIRDAVRKGRHSSKTHPDRQARGDRSGSRLHPERLARGANHGLAVLCDSDVLHIHAALSVGATTRSLAVRFNVSEVTIHDIKVGRTWRHLNLRALPVKAYNRRTIG